MNILGIIASAAGKAGKTPTTPTGYLARNSNTLETIKEFPFATETYSNLSLSIKVWGNIGAPFADSASGGYLPGTGASSGTDTASQGRNTVKFNFQTKTYSFITQQLTFDQYAAGATTNNGVAGYVIGGSIPPSYSGGVSTINKMPYSTETPASISATLGTPRATTNGVQNGSTAGYVMGGSPNQGATVNTTINKIAYSNDTESTLSAALGTRTAARGAGVYGGVSGFTLGGYTNPGDIATVQRLTFSNETTDQPTSLVNAMRENSTIYQETTAAYNNPGTGGSTITQKLTYSTFTLSSLAFGDGYDYTMSLGSDQGTV
jgi:hypothetical protein